MTVRQSILLFGFSTVKTVCDHGGYAFPMWLDPLHLFFPNTSEYHDVHHQMQGLKFNYSQPFFIHFDVVFGTRMSAEKFQKMREVNNRFKTEKSIETKQQSASSTDEKSASIDLRQRSAANTNLDQDQSPEDIVLRQGEKGDPTVTLDAESYRAKAGVST
jgi:sphinganine C4-monooxygenase